MTTLTAGICKQLRQRPYDQASLAKRQRTRMTVGAGDRIE